MTCNRNCDCVGECKAGNEKPTTPTPGDLSARHVEVLREFVGRYAGQIDNRGEYNSGLFTRVLEAIAALSALPAAGGAAPVAWTTRESLEMVQDADCGTGLMGRLRTDYHCIPLYTTPQPSAADDYESWAKQERQRQDTATRLGSAAVGAQGDGYDAHEYMEERVAKDLKWFREERASRLAAPAAGKGVDDAMVRDLLPDGWTPDCQGKQDYDVDLVSLSCRYYPGNYSHDGSHSVIASLIYGEGQHTISTREFSAASEAAVKALAEEWARQQITALAAALTRQPVAGDGWRPIESAPKDGRTVILCHLSSEPFMGRWSERRAWWVDAADSLRDPTHWQPNIAAPAATPTDGGEGKS